MMSWAELSAAEENGFPMNYSDRGRYACYDTPYLSMTFRAEDGWLAFLGLDSGGRRPDHKNTYNLLKPSFGARALGGEVSHVEHGTEGVRVEGKEGTFAFQPGATEREVAMSFEAPEGRLLKETFFEASLSIATAPPTIWAETDPEETPWITERNQAPGVHGERTWSLPMRIHFPDYGTLRVESDDGAVECHETLLETKEMRGLSLGYQNFGGHNEMVALHHGISRLEFRVRAGESRAKVGLRFTVEPEIAPQAPFVAGREWDGFRRAWLNNFPLNRCTLSMGDNIKLEGIAHLSEHNKADMLELCDPAMHPVFGKIRETFVHAIDLALLHYQAPDGEVCWEYAEGKKKEGQLTASFIDCGPSNLIGALVALRWVPEKLERWLEPLLRLGDFLMRMDSDGDGLIEIPFNGRSYKEPWNHPGGRPRIWWDNFANGHKDAWFNLLVHRGLRMLLPVAREAGRKEEAAKIGAFLKKFRANFMRELFNPESGVIAGWKDDLGRLHDYHFTFPTALAVNEGVVSKAEGKRMLRRLLKYMKAAGFGDNRFGIPGNTLAVPLNVDTFDWAFMAEWPRYENGGCCGMTAWHFLNALYRVGMEAEADAIYFRMLHTVETMPTHSGLFPGYMESVDWRTKDGNPCGYNYLADNYLFLAAGYVHHAGMKHPAMV